MSKSKWKIKYLHKSLTKLDTRKRRFVWSRSSIIPSFLVGFSVKVHNGKEFKNVQITEDKVGYKFGEFSITRKRRIPVLNKKKNKKFK